MSKVKSGEMMNEEQKDLESYRNAIARMNRLGAFDRDGLHSANWGRMRSAAHLLGPISACSWPGCSDPKVVRSHTIAKASGLGPIQRNQHVLMPDFDQHPVSMSLRGVKRQATIFPGYCNEHEQRFQVFEQDGVLKSISDVALQLFRSTAREYSNKRQKYAYLRAVWDEYVDVLITRPASPVHTNLANEVLEPLENIMHRMSEEARLLGALWKACFDLTEFRDATNAIPIPRMVRRTHVQTSRRIALSGSTFMDAEDMDGHRHRIPVVVVMLPTQTGVDVLSVTVQAAADQYESNLNDLVRSAGGDAVVDSWLVEADWWCADPDWWEGADSTWRKSILQNLASI